MFKNLTNIFRHPTDVEIRSRQKAEAERKLAEVEADLEYVTAMRDMYRARLERLNRS